MMPMLIQIQPLPMELPFGLVPLVVAAVVLLVGLISVLSVALAGEQPAATQPLITLPAKRVSSPLAVPAHMPHRRPLAA